MDNIERAVNDMKHGNPQCASVLELLTNEVSEIKKTTDFERHPNCASYKLRE